MTITVTAVNDAPVADRRHRVAPTEDTALADQPAGVLANDTDVDGDALTVAGADQARPRHASRSTPTAPSPTRPTPNFDGTDSFTYTRQRRHRPTRTSPP